MEIVKKFFQFLSINLTLFIFFQILFYFVEFLYNSLYKTKGAMKRADKAGGLSTGFIKKKWKARPPKPIPKISDQDTYRVNAILLNKNTFRITEVNNGNGKYKKRTKKRACIA